MKFATITDRYGVVENQDSCLKLEAIRSDETKCGSPSPGSESLPVARAATAARYCLQPVTNFAVSTTCTSVRRIRAAASGWASRSRSQAIVRSRPGTATRTRPSRDRTLIAASAPNIGVSSIEIGPVRGHRRKQQEQNAIGGKRSEQQSHHIDL